MVLLGGDTGVSDTHVWEVEERHLYTGKGVVIMMGVVEGGYSLDHSERWPAGYTGVRGKKSIPTGQLN